MANFIVCVAHFCELHGPTIIICTQITSQTLVDDHILQSNARLANCQSCQLILPNSSANLTTKTTTNNSICISTHYPSSSKRYSVLTKLVMKSLSVETTSELSKPMFYGDAVTGYCINQIFKIEDVNARGGERKYSLMIACDDEVELLNNWDIVSIYFNEIIDSIQTRVEEAKTKRKKNSNANVLDNERFLRRSLIKPKSLVDLTDDDQIFVKIHLLSTELLSDIIK
ncbi:LST7 Protein LST7 [Candida maltosa Xu316]